MTIELYDESTEFPHVARFKVKPFGYTREDVEALVKRNIPFIGTEFQGLADLDGKIRQLHTEDFGVLARSHDITKVHLIGSGEMGYTLAFPPRKGGSYIGLAEIVLTEEQ